MENHISFDGTSNYLTEQWVYHQLEFISSTSFTRTSQLYDAWIYHHINHGNPSDLNNDVGFITSIVTGDFSVSGNISIGGTLTYEDVTNVDSVGLVTQDLVSKFQIVRKSMLVLVMIFRSIMMEITVILMTHGTGNLRLRSGRRDYKPIGSKKSAEFNSGGVQELYFNNTKRFETSNTGALITGLINWWFDLSNNRWFSQSGHCHRWFW